ncbi:MAG: DNA-directed RNA polymerase subunit N [Thermoproteota archaeon]|nr:MAG: DNA-directed RNA polymerase subunit N [Candidatus Korarchaeota archaeon]HDN02142.1 DNA-directed RNA polymerase subunit N [Candidatus Bathyarchaeota archaeon]
MFPVRCYTCGAVIGDKYEKYTKLVKEGKTPGEALDILGINRYCCRRMFLGHVDLIDEQLEYFKRGE